MIEIAAIVMGIITIALAVSSGLFEIQVEGDESLAKALPCWKGKLPIIGETTGYHLTAFVFVHILMIFLIAVLIFTDVIKLGAFIGKLRIFLPALYSFIALGMLFEDFLWNVMNPSEKFGVKDFTKKFPQYGTVVWVAGIIPRQYIIQAFISLVLAALAGIAAEWFVVILVMLAVTAVIADYRYRLDVKREVK